LITPLLPAKPLILLLAACLVWTGILSLGYLAFTKLALSSGWIIGGALAFAVVAWLLVMFREFRQAIPMPDFSANGERTAGDYEPAGNASEIRPRADIHCRLFFGRRVTTATGRGAQTRIRKRRSQWVETSAR
jgi:hypothetical protein